MAGARAIAFHWLLRGMGTRETEKIMWKPYGNDGKSDGQHPKEAGGGGGEKKIFLVKNIISVIITTELCTGGR